MNSQNLAHFSIHPSVVFQLGESLISDEIQAIIELVKNSYDADAKYAKITIETDPQLDNKKSDNLAGSGRITIEDDGCGMSHSDIESGWLTISNRKKHEMKLAKQTTKGERTPLGDKGLGRLGVQRLGNYLEIYTQVKGGKGYYLNLSWEDFATAPTLDHVDIRLEEIQFERPHGTRIVVTDLIEPSLWRGSGASERLQHEISKMLSPYKKIRDFTVFVTVDGKKLDIIEISDQVRDVAPIRYRLEFDGDVLSVHGKVKLDFFRPQKSDDAERFSLIAESDNGAKLLDYLIQSKYAKSISLRKSESSKWLAQFEKRFKLSSLDKVQHTNGPDSPIANPGPFDGEIDSFDLGRQSFNNQNIFNKLGEFREFIKTSSGVKVYRDGFAIRVDDDWLKLGSQWTSASSYYTLKPDNTLGYIALSAKHNMELEETTDREGFRDTPHYRNFFSLLTQFVKFTSESNEYFRRSYLEFRNQRNETIARVDSRKTIEDVSSAITGGIKRSLADLPRQKKQLESIEARLALNNRNSPANIRAMVSSIKNIDPQIVRDINEMLSHIEPLRDEAAALVRDIASKLEEMSKLNDLQQVLDDRVESLRRQMDDVYETVALGLTAEALSHEVFNVADNLTRRSKTISSSIKKSNISTPLFGAFVEHVLASANALRKQMSHLTPSLKFVREQKHQISVDTFISEVVDFYKEKLAIEKIEIWVDLKKTQAFDLKINKGKLTQIFDNLIINSEYWLKEDIAQHRKASGKITIEVSHPFVRIYDDGTGINPVVEDNLFEPFITAKANGYGRGLGLFIIKQLLDSEGCNIGLIPERNTHDRLFKFQIDFRGALNV